MVCRMEKTYDEIIDILDINYFAGSTIGYFLKPGINGIIGLNSILKSLLRNGYG